MDKEDKMPSFKCADIGMKNDPFEVKTATKEELMKMVALHAKETHGMEKLDPALVKQVEKAVKQ